MTSLLTIFDMFAATVAQNRDAACICVPARAGRAYAANGLELSYGETHDQVFALREIYRHAGYGPGHRVGLLLDSRPDILIHFLALNSMGASIVPLNPDNTPAELRYAIEHADVVLVVTLAERVALLRNAIAEMRRLPLIVLGADILSEIPPPLTAKQPGTPDRGTEAAIVYTSGTTAAPKACVLTNEYGYSAGRRYIEAGGAMTIERGKERLFNPLPLFYVNSLLITNMAMIQAGGCMIFPDRFHPTTWWKDVIATRATIVQYLGIVMPVLLNLPSCPEETSHGLKFGVGAGIDPTRHREAEERFGIPMFEVWGMTEVAIASIANHEPRHIDTRSIGRPLDGIRFKIVDDERTEVPAGTPGELLVQAAGADPRLGLVGHYLKDTESTSRAWQDGWFHTGDLVVQELDGSFRFVERVKDIIRRSGQNIACSEVEAGMSGHPAIAQAVAMPVKDEFREEEVIACVVLRDKSKASRETAESIVRWSLDRVSYFKAPGWVVFIDALPVTYTQKVQKRSIFAANEDPRQRPDCHDFRELKKPQRAPATA